VQLPAPLILGAVQVLAGEPALTYDHGVALFGAMFLETVCAVQELSYTLLATSGLDPQLDFGDAVTSGFPDFARILKHQNRANANQKSNKQNHCFFHHPLLFSELQKAVLAIPGFQILQGHYLRQLIGAVCIFSVFFESLLLCDVRVEGVVERGSIVLVCIN
jgi:hypothetical protein